MRAAHALLLLSPVLDPGPQYFESEAPKNHPRCLDPLLLIELPGSGDGDCRWDVDSDELLEEVEPCSHKSEPPGSSCLVIVFRLDQTSAWSRGTNVVSSRSKSSAVPDRLQLVYFQNLTERR